VFDETVTPEYVVSYPNGPDCNVCRAADMQIAVP
jgi:hypothetical protein